MPEEADVESYINTVLAMDQHLFLVDQYRLLLESANQSIIGAAFLGTVSSRIMSRNLDTRAYPNIIPTESDMVNWAQKISQIEFREGKIDLTGDVYYFWTSFLGGYTYMQRSDFTSNTIDVLFKNGNLLMSTARKLAGQQVIGGHIESSTIGRSMGIQAAKDIQNRFQNLSRC